MPDLARDPRDHRDHRLSLALDLLGQTVARRRNGAAPLVAISCLMLSAVLLVSLANSPDKTPAAATATAGKPAPPPVDFELSDKPAGSAPDVASVAAGQEPQR